MEGVLGPVAQRPSRARRAVLRSNGIRSRYYAIDPTDGSPTHNNAALAAEAVRRLRNGRLSLDDIDCLACGTSMPDQLMPGHASMVHGELGGPSIEAVSTAGVCVAGVSALRYAAQGVALGDYRAAVATGSELASASMRGALFQPEVAAKIEALERQPELAFEKDFLRWMLSDGAGAALLEPTPNSGRPSLRLDWIHLRSFANEMSACMYAGAEKQPDGRLRGWREFSPQEWLDRSIFSVKQDVKQLNEHVVHYTVERPLAQLRERRGLSAEAIDWFIPHFSSEFFRERVAEGMRRAGVDIPYERWYSNLSECGNTGSASIYIMLAELLGSGRLRPGQTLLCYVPESGRFSTALMHLTVCGPHAT